MARSADGDLRRERDGHHLDPLGEARQALADGVGDGGSRSPSMRAYCWDRIHLTKASASSGETFA